MSYDNWLMSGAHDGEDEEIYIENRVAELMDEEDYDPSDVSHMAEAISEASEDDQQTIRDYIEQKVSEASEEDQQTIRDYIEQKAWDKLGLKLYTMTYDYMENYAESTAQREVQQGAHL